MKALSVRQPWAWLIVNGHKDIENRDWKTHVRGQVLIHAGATMTRDDYLGCTIFIAAMKTTWRLPAYDILKRECGGLVGQVEIIDCVKESYSQWFCGPYGFVLRNPIRLEFLKYKGQLGFFDVSFTPNISAPSAPSAV